MQEFGRQLRAALNGMSSELTQMRERKVRHVWRNASRPLQNHEKQR